jgi:hypothetical protein
VADENKNRAEELLERGLAEVDPGSEEIYRRGFRIIAGLSQEQVKSLIYFMADGGNRPTYGHETSDAAQLVGVSDNSAGLALTAMGLVIAMVGMGSVAARDLVAAMGTRQLVETESMGSVEQLTQLVERLRAELRRRVRERRLADQTLPSLSGFSASVDMRFGFQGAEISRRTVVAIALLRTDQEGEEVRFQMTRGQVERLRQDLERIAKRMDQVASSRPSAG